MYGIEEMPGLETVDTHPAGISRGTPLERSDAWYLRPPPWRGPSPHNAGSVRHTPSRRHSGKADRRHGNRQNSHQESGVAPGVMTWWVQPFLSLGPEKEFKARSVYKCEDSRSQSPIQEGHFFVFGRLIRLSGTAQARRSRWNSTLRKRASVFGQQSLEQ